MKIEFGRTADDYVRHRAGFPAELFDRLKGFGLCRPGQRVLDLGTGTGTLARGFALAGCAVVGLDRSTELIDQARALDRAAGVSIDYRTGTAEETGFGDDSFEVVAAGQCWHWFDRPRAAAEARRVLVADAKLVICHFDWLPLPGNMVRTTEKLIERHNPNWQYGKGTGIYPWWPADLSIAGFRDLETFSFDLDVPYSHEDWRGRVRASAGIGASLPADRIAQFDDALAALLAAQFPQDPLAVPHRVWALVARTPAAEG